MVNMSQALVLDLPRGSATVGAVVEGSPSHSSARMPRSPTGHSLRLFAQSYDNIEVVAMCISQVYRHPHHRQRQHYMARVELRGL